MNDVDNPLIEEGKLLKFSDFVRESNTKKAFYVPWSSWFDMNKYDIDKMKETINLFLDEKFVWTENQGGVSNQPEVVCFLSDSNLVPRIIDKLNVVFDTQWIRANEKEW